MLPLKLAKRELRGGLRDFRLFLGCTRFMHSPDAFKSRSTFLIANATWIRNEVGVAHRS